jgi:hypothetical protein
MTATAASDDRVKYPVSHEQLRTAVRRTGEMLKRMTAEDGCPFDPDPVIDVLQDALEGKFNRPMLPPLISVWDDILKALAHPLWPQDDSDFRSWNDVMHLPLMSTGLLYREWIALRPLDIEQLWELLEFTPEALLKLPGFGKGTLKHVEFLLADMGLRLSREDDFDRRRLDRRPIPLRNGRHTKEERLIFIPVSQLDFQPCDDLAAAEVKCLSDNGVETIYRLTQTTREGLEALPWQEYDLSTRSVDDIIAALGRSGLKLAVLPDIA